MMTQKDRLIANQKLMIGNRDKLIQLQQEKLVKAEAKLINIKAIASMNKYNNPEVYLRKIKELIDCESN